MFNTDKYSHGFIDVYTPYFNKLSNVKNVLEIGVYSGDSLNYFSTTFKDANIYGIDINDMSVYDTDRIKTYIVNQESRESLNSFLNNTNIEFDIILDDGGHTMRQQQISFGVLFKHLKNGGLYILEDLHTSRYNSYITKNDLITTLDMLYSFSYTNNLISNHITNDEKEYIESNVENIFIWSRNTEHNMSVTSIITKK